MTISKVNSWGGPDLMDVLGQEAVVKSVTSGDDKAELQFEDGRRLVLDLYGDCCSQSYYHDKDQFNELVGAKIIGLEQRSTDPVGSEEPFNDYYEGTVSPHVLVFATDKGHVTIDWRNESNGYYDGWVEMSLEVPESDVTA